MPKRIQGYGALLLATFFAVAGAFHHHALQAPSHDHAGFCSAAANVVLETCAICKAAQTAARLAVKTIGSFAVDEGSRLDAFARCAPPSVGASLLPPPRAPPLA